MILKLSSFIGRIDSRLIILILLAFMLHPASSTTIQVVKLQESVTFYNESGFDSYSLSSYVSGLNTTQQYAMSMWINKLAWPSDGKWETFLRLSNDQTDDTNNGRILYFNGQAGQKSMFRAASTGDMWGGWENWEGNATTNTSLLPNQWVFIASAVNSATQNQSGFRYTLTSTDAQTIVFANRPSPGGLFYDLTSNATVFVGGDNLDYESCNCNLSNARVYINYFPNSNDEYINLALMDTGVVYIFHFSSTPQVNSNQTVVVDSISETSQGSLTALKGLSASDAVSAPYLNIDNVLNCRTNSILSFYVGGAAPNGIVIAMDIRPLSGGPSTQTLLSIRDNSTNAISFVAELSDSTGYLTFYRKDSTGEWQSIPTSLALQQNTWNRLIIEYTQAQPTVLAGAYYSLRIFVGNSSMDRTYFADTGTPSDTVLFWGVDNMVLDFCSQLVDATVPSVRQTTKDGNYDILNFLMFSGPSGVYQNTSLDPTCLQSAFLNYNQTACLLCASGYFLYDKACYLTCPSGSMLDSGTGSCQVCQYGYQYNLYPICNNCTSTQVFFNETCLDSCPDGYVATAVKECAICSGGQYYYNNTCLSSCPLTTYADVATYSCELCYFGCDTCTGGTKYECSNCSEGYFYLNYTCNSGCPSDMYADPDTRTCEQCQSPCVTCSQPNDLSCTDCPQGYYLLNGTCVTSCPTNYYQSLGGESGVYQVPVCLPKLILIFNLSLTTNPYVININFNYGIGYMILAISQRMQIQISNVQIDPQQYILSPLTESSIKFEYLGNQYYPPRSLLNITIDLLSDFNTNPFNTFLIISRSQTIQLNEIYPFSNAEAQAISIFSTFSGVAGRVVAVVQVASFVSRGSTSLSLVRLQMTAQIVQMMRFFNIRWPPSVGGFFQSSRYDPCSILLPFDFITSWNTQVSNRNFSMPRIFQSYEIAPFFSENYNYEFSNLILWVAIFINGSRLINYLKKKLRKMTKRMPSPKTDADGKLRDKYIQTIHKMSRFMNRIDKSMLWNHVSNFLLLFILSIFQGGNLWALLNIRYGKSLLEPPTFYTTATLVIATAFFCFYILIAALIFEKAYFSCKYIINTKESLWPLHLKKYRSLFEDSDNQNRAQILFVPVYLVRSLLFGILVSLLSPNGLVQIIILWIVDLAFIIYAIIYRPLKDKWMRIFTLAIEIFAFACITLGFIFAIIDKVANIDIAILDELGYVFISFSLASTFGGILISLVQSLPLVKMAILRLKQARRRSRQIYPISLSTLSNKISDTREADSDEKVLGPKQDYSEKTNTPNYTPLNFPISKIERNSKLLKDIGNCPPDIFEKIPRGDEFLKNLDDWFKSVNSHIESEAADLIPLKPKSEINFELENRINFVSGNPVNLSE